MESEEAQKFLRDVARELRDLGPFESHRALANVKADLVDFAMDGKQMPPSSGRLDEARRIMPSAREIAQAYLASARPPKTSIRLSLLYNLLLFLGPLYLAVIIIKMTFLPAYGSTLVLSDLLFIVLFLFLGVFGFLVYLTALLSPVHAMRWRFAVLPGLAIALVADFLLATVILFQSQIPWILVFGLPLAMLLCGIYSAGYAFTQLPRLVPHFLVARHGREYFRTLSRCLRDLDRTSRVAIAAELRAHLEAAGVDLKKPPSSERYAAVANVLGAPDEVAVGYLRGTDTRLTRKQRRASILVLIVALLGGAVGTVFLIFVLWSLTWGLHEVLPLGLFGSVGILVLSIAGLAGVLHLRRTPVHWPDFGPPTIALGLAGALSIASVLGGLSSGDYIRPVHLVDYSIEAEHRSTDGGLDILWSSWDLPEGWTNPFESGYGTLREIRLTHLDADRNVISSGAYPPGRPPTPILAFEHEGDTWVTLSATLLSTFGYLNSETQLSPLPGYRTASARIDGEVASIAWASHEIDPSSGNGTLSVRFDSFHWIGIMQEMTWTREFSTPLVSYNPRIWIAQDTNRLLVALELLHVNDTASSSSIRAFLLDTEGNSLANLTLVQESIQRNGSYDSLNGTFTAISSIQIVPGAFWVIGGSSKVSGGIREPSIWASRIDSRNGTANTTELLRFGPNEVYGASPWAVVTGDRVLVTTYAMGDISMPTAGGLFLSNFYRYGGLNYTIRLADSLIEGWPAWPLLSGWNATPMVLVPLFTTDWTESIRVRTYTVAASSLQIQKGEMIVGVPEAALLYSALSSALGSAIMPGYGAGPGVMEFVGQVIIEDYGLFGWRKNTGYENLREAFLPAPAVVRFDIQRGDSEVVLLAQPDRVPDTVAGLFFVFIATASSVTTLMFGYPRWRSWRASRRTQAPVD